MSFYYNKMKLTLLLHFFYGMIAKNMLKQEKERKHQIKETRDI